MKRLLALALFSCLAVALLPAVEAAAVSPDNIRAFPSIDTKELTNPETITGYAFNGNTPLSGILLDFGIVAGGPNAGVNFGGGLPAGVFGECTTGLNGSCSQTYTGLNTGADTIRIWNDLAPINHIFDSGELERHTLVVTWYAVGQGTRRIRIDAEGCDGDISPPIDDTKTTWDQVAKIQTVTVQASHEICAERFLPTDGLGQGPMTFTISSGPGRFVDPLTNTSLGTSIVRDLDNTGTYNRAYIQSSLVGTSTITGTAEGITSSITVPWGTTPDLARIVAISSSVSTISPGQSLDLVAHVTDRFGNDDPGVPVTFTEAGPGSFSGGTSSVVVTTGQAGTATATLLTATGDAGTNSVTATLNPASTECEEIKDNPTQGAPAGICNASKSITIQASTTLLSIVVTPPVATFGNAFAVQGILSTAGGAPISGRTVRVLGRGANERDFTLVGTSVTDAAGRYVVAARPSKSTQFQAVFAGDPAYDAIASRVVSGVVRVGISLNLASAHIETFAPAILTGRVLPEHPGTQVFLQALLRGVWTTIRTGRLDANSAFRFGVFHRGVGQLLFRVAAPSNGEQAWNVSRNVMENWGF